MKITNQLTSRFLCTNGMNPPCMLERSLGASHSSTLTLHDEQKRTTPRTYSVTETGRTIKYM
jgi:hypothetical protein